MAKVKEVIHRILRSDATKWIIGFTFGYLIFLLLN
jgi:hypothetical protein